MQAEVVEPGEFLGEAKDKMEEAELEAKDKMEAAELEAQLREGQLLPPTYVEAAAPEVASTAVPEVANSAAPEVASTSALEVAKTAAAGVAKAVEIQATEAEPHLVVTLEKGLGLELDFWPDCIQICKIQDGTAMVYNDEAGEGRKIEVNDFILQVNEATDPGEMKVLLKRGAQNFTLTFGRAKRFTVTLDRGQDALGMKLIFGQRKGTCLCVTTLFAGRVSEYNRTVPSEMQVIPGSLISKINGTEGSSKELYTLLQAEKEKVEMEILRVPRL